MQYRRSEMNSSFPSPVSSIYLRIAALLTVATATFLTSIAVLAQPLIFTSGPFEIIADENVGNYRIIVHQSPERAIIGAISYAVQVHERETGEIVPDAIVKVYASPSEYGTKQVAPALNTPDDREYYVGRLEIEEAGVWAIDVVIEHHELGNSTITLATEVFERSRGGDNLVVGTILWVFVSIAFVGIIFYLIRKSRRAKTELERLRNQPEHPDV